MGNSNLSYGDILTAAQWNQKLNGKQEALGFTPVNRAGDTWYGKMMAYASSTTLAGFNLQPGSSPDDPVDGDIWTTTTGLFVQIAGSTIGPIRNGNVAGPEIAVVGNLAVFDSTTGAILADGGLSAENLVQAAAQTFTSPQQAQIQANIGLTDAFFLAILNELASAFPAAPTTGSPGLWRNGDDGFICFS